MFCVQANRKQSWQFRDPWPWHESITTLYSWIMMSSRLLPPLLYNYVQSRIIMTHSVNIFMVYTVSLVVYTLHTGTAIFTSWTRWTVFFSFFFNLTSYTFSPHLIMSQGFTALTSDPRDRWPIYICWPIWPTDQYCLLRWRENETGRTKEDRCCLKNVVCYSFFFIFLFQDTCARLSWPHSTFQPTLNSSIVSKR